MDEGYFTLKVPVTVRPHRNWRIRGTARCWGCGQVASLEEFPLSGVLGLLLSITYRLHMQSPSVPKGARSRDGDEIPNAPQSGLFNGELGQVVTFDFIDCETDGSGCFAIIAVDDLSCQGIDKFCDTSMKFAE